MTTTQPPLRADARRNREKILASAGDVFARLGAEAQMDEIAKHCGLGLGTLYRHFPTKDALLSAVVRRRFEAVTEMARAAEHIDNPGDAVEAVLRGYLEAAATDAAFQLALLGSHTPRWEDVAGPKTALRTVVTRLIHRAVAAGAVRADLTFSDFPMLACGVTSTMYFKPGGNPDWRRHLELVLDAIRPQPITIATPRARQ